MSSLVDRALRVLDMTLDDEEEQILARFRTLVPKLEFKQLPIDDASKQNLLQIRLNIFYDKVDELSEKMYTGDISIGDWQESLKKEIRMIYNSSAAIGKGGWDQMGPRDWGRLGTPLREQYRYLQGFAEHVATNRDTVSLKYIKARTRLYGEGAFHATTMIEAGFWFSDTLPWLPKDGSTECLNRCHCWWSLEVTSTTKRHQVVRATWNLGVADHCDTCLQRSGHVEILQVPLDVTVPSKIGGH